MEQYVKIFALISSRYFVVAGTFFYVFYMILSLYYTNIIIFF